MRIAYLINQYPKVSHSFIRREILALERKGLEVFRISIRGHDSQLFDSEDLSEQSKTYYVLRLGALALAGALLRMLVKRPLLLMSALVLAVRMSRHSERALPIHLFYLAEACQIEPWLRRRDITHLHAHFGTNSAEVAMLVHALGGPKWSFTVHGPEEFDKPRFIGLNEKLRRCAFVVGISSFANFFRVECTQLQSAFSFKPINRGLQSEPWLLPEILLTCTPTLVPIRQKLRCWCTLLEVRNGASRCTGQKNLINLDLLA